MEPEQRVADFIKAGSDIVSVHAEQSATIHLHRLVNNVRNSARHMQHLRQHGLFQLFPIKYSLGAPLICWHPAFYACWLYVQIKDLGAKAGVVLNPGTSLTAIEEVTATYSSHWCHTQHGACCEPWDVHKWPSLVPAFILIPKAACSMQPCCICLSVSDSCPCIGGKTTLQPLRSSSRHVHA